MPIFTAATPAQRGAIDRYLNSRIKAPYVYTQVSTLGGVARASAIIKVSLSPRNKWPNDILQNSRYYMFSIHRDGTLELFAGNVRKKMRKSKVTSLPDAVLRINKYLASERG